MSRKRTLHDLRNVARARQSDWWGRVFDELFFMFLSGARGVNTDYVFPTTYGGFAGNALSAPDSDHIVYAAGATSKATVSSSTLFSCKTLDKAIAKAETMGGGSTEIPSIQPVNIEGDGVYVVVAHPWQIFDLRTDVSSGTGTGNWLDVQKAAAGKDGQNSPIFKGSEGMYNNCVVHKHRGVVRFSDYGSGSNVPAARALFLGQQAGAIAFGSAGGSELRFSWHEESRDNGNQVVITSNAIFGIKKCTFNSRDFGVVAIDTYCKDPNLA
jgi:N4-gp56 family major capsid protein